MGYRAIQFFFLILWPPSDHVDEPFLFLALEESLASFVLRYYTSAFHFPAHVL